MKTTSKTSEKIVPEAAEVVPAASVVEVAVEGGVYRSDVAARLEKIGAALTDSQLADQADAVAAKQAGYVAAAVTLGAMLEAKWAAICAKNRSAGKNNLKHQPIGVDTRVHTDNIPSFPQFCERVFGPGSARNMRRYRWLGRRYLLAATEALHAHSSELASSLQAGEGAPEDAEKLMLQLATGTAGGLTLRNWIAGRSLSSLIRDLRAAEAEALAEEAAEAAAEADRLRREAAEKELAEATDEAEADAGTPEGEAWRQLDLPGFLSLARRETESAYDALDRAAGIAPRGVLKKLWTDYRAMLAAKVAAADAKLLILNETRD